MRIKQPRRGGMTLVELLVVVAMASVLLAITVSSLRGSFSDRKLRETSRIVTAFMARAKARAAETGRPTGVVFVREVAPDPADPASFNFCRKLFIAETPPPYAGDIAGATCTVSNPAVVVAGTPPGMVLAADIPTVAFGFGPFVLPDPVGLLEGPSAYQIKLDYRGEQFPIVKVAGVPIVQVLGATSRVFFFVPAQSNSIWQNMIVGAPVATGVTFQITRPPEVGASQPIDLPTGIVIDLSNSGIGVLGRQFLRTDLQALTIMFAPDGGVDFINHRGVYEYPSATIHLLIGQRDQMTPTLTLPFSSGDATPFAVNDNLQDPTSTWISIGHLTGTVSSQDNSWRLFGEGPNPFDPPHFFASSMAEARSLAIKMKSEGGN